MEGTAMFFLIFYFLFFHKVYAAEFDNISGSRFLTDGDTLVSETGVFELGFFRPEGSENKYLGIWFKKVSVRTVVWVANRERPVLGASPVVLKMVDPGILVISQNNIMIWSSNTTITSRKATAKLHDNGNLVLMDQQEKTIWQSFDYPTDTSVYGMKTGIDYSRGIKWYLSSWKNSQDPAPGEFTWSVETHEKHGYPEKKLKQGSLVKFRGGLWSNQQVKSYTKGHRSLTTAYNVILGEKEVSFSYHGNTSIPSRITLNSSGLLEVSVWVEDSKKWKLRFQIPTDMCDTYNICSAYGSCNVSMVPNVCVCLDEKRFVPRNQEDWEKADWSGGCVRRTPLDCKNGSEGFIKYSNVKLPDTEHARFNTSMSMKDCEAECLKNCSCMAYANPEIGSQASACLLWFDDLIDTRLSPQSSGGIDLFVRMASSELVVQSDIKRKGGSHIKVILLVIFPGVLLISVISTWLWYAWIKSYNGQTEEGGSFHVSKNKEEDIQLPLFSFSTIATATANFSTGNIIGEGGFGPVYKGVLEEGLQIAVKRLSLTSDQGVDEFKNEVICISRLQHRNLVKLLGCCINEDEKVLIYEYMPNKSLDSFIFDESRSMFLDWTERFNIIKGIARGLVYLHHDSRLRIIHRDLKAENILLDQDMNPKISDFGLARSFGGNETQANTKRVVGTRGYMSPEYLLDGIFSIKSDAFSYGVLVLEIVSGNRNRGFIHPEHDNNLIGHAWSLYNEGRTMELIDVNLAKSCHLPEVVRSIEVGLLCVQGKARDRPNMAYVVRMLDCEGTLPQPKQPAFFTTRDLLIANRFSSINREGSINGLTFSQLDAR